MKGLRGLICAGLAAAALFSGIYTMGIQAQAEEMQEERKDISECTFENSLGAYGSIAILPSERYTGNEIHPEIIIKDGNYTLIEGTDYEVSPYYLADNVNANATPWYSFEHDYGEDCPQVVVYGNGRYKGLKQMIFAILSESQKETEGHLIYSDKAVLAEYDGVTIDGYVGAETEVEIPAYIDGKPVQEINKNAFAYNPTLEKVDIPDSVFRIMDGAFCHCGNLSEVKLSRQLWGISNYGFAECTSLKELSLPASLEKLGFDVFAGSTALEVIHSQSEAVYDVDGVLYEKHSAGFDKNCLYFYPPAKKMETFCIPDGTEEINLCAFWDAGGIKNLIIPFSVKLMYAGKYGSFYGMTSPVNIVFKYDAPSGILKADLFYDLPAGSTVTVKNEEMKEAAEAAVSEQCRDNVTVRVARKASEGFELARNSFILSKGEQAQLCWTMVPMDTTENVTWQSQNPVIAEVDPVQGKITAKGYGKCTITGTDESGHEQEVDVFVYDACTRQTFMLDCSGGGETFKEDERYSTCVLPEMVDGKREGSFAPGSMATVVAFADGYAGDMPIRFENSAEDVVAIAGKTESTYRTGIPTDDGGYVCQDNKYTRLYLEFLKPGTAIITAVFDGDGQELRESITVHVEQPGGAPGSENQGGSGNGDPQGSGNQTGTGNGKQDQELQCPKSIKKAYGSKPFGLNVKHRKGDGRLSYLSSNPKVARVENGRVTIKGTGRTVITVVAGETANYRKKTAKVTVDVTPKRQKASVKAAGKRKLKVRWRKDARATGYVVQYSTDRKFKKGVKSTSVKKGISAKTLVGLKAGRAYYVRVRAYKSVKSGKKTTRLYGQWSGKVKSRKVK